MNNSKPLIIFGGGRGGADVIQLVKQLQGTDKTLGYQVMGVVDPKGGDILGIPVWKKLPNLDDLDGGPFYGVSGNQDPETRQRIFEEEISSNNIKKATLIHPAVNIPDDIEIAAGCVIYPGVCIGQQVKIGEGVLINYLSLIGVGVQIGEFSFIGPHACITADCSVGIKTIIGAGSSLIPGIRIGARCIVGLGSRVLTDIPDDHRLVQLPRQYLRPTSELRKGRVSWASSENE
jgi:sugar O-acyltransferase (sialic acid O-acetyltransferase NeuD family)